MKTLHQIQLTERDLDILDTLWRWKVLTSTSIFLRHFPNAKPRTGYNRLVELSSVGYIEQIAISRRGNQFVWSLANRGFAAIQSRLQPLKSIGFKSETINHDLLCTALNLGEWLQRIPQGISVFSEQELRHRSLGAYPEWVPKTEIHRPDGYCNVPIASERWTIALEVELHRKSSVDYRNVADFYANFRSEIHRILWLVPNRSRANALWQLVSKATPGNRQRHAFILLKDFERRGLQTAIHFGSESGKPLHSLLNWGSKGTSVNLLPQAFFDKRKCPFKPITSAELQKVKKCNRLGL